VRGGAELRIECNGCGARLPAGARFCLDCGRPVDAGPAPASYTPRHLIEQILEGRAALRGELKQVTVLFCDIVHSTAHTQRLGPEGMHALMNRFFTRAAEQVHRYEGTINQFLGDGFMALFGAPIAHEDHSRRAVLAAIGLRDALAGDEALSGVEIRQGINSGQIVVGAIGDDLRMDYTAFGDTVVLAARLEAAAAPNEIVVSDSTARAVRGYFEVEIAPAAQVKERQLRPLRIVGPGTRQSRLEDTDRRLAPFVGRDGDLAALTNLGDHGTGRIVGIVGEPGIGKSRLVHEFLAAAGDGATTYAGRCLSFGSASSYLPVLALLRETCGIAPSDSRAESSAKLAATLARADVDAESALPFLLHLLGDAGALARLSELDPATIKGGTFDALTALWVGLAARAPLVVVVEDLHWIDRTSEEFLAAFADELAASPIVVVATYRPGYAPPWTGKSYATQMALSPLSPSDSHELLQSTVSLPEEVALEIIARAEGNPFFLEELAHAAAEAGGRLSMPGTITEVLAARIDRLAEGPRRALQCGAVLGREFTQPLLEVLLEGDAGAQLQELKRSELLFERRAPDRAFVFKHALTQSVAYDGLLESRRRELHGRAGHAIERLAADRLDDQYELLAYHFARSDEDEKAAEYLILANRKAGARNAMEEAISYFYDAVEALRRLADTRENRIRHASLLLEQTGEFHFLHRHREYYELLLGSEPLIRGLGDDFLLGSYLARLGHQEVTMQVDDFTRVAARLHEAAEICERVGNVVDAGAAYAFLVWTYHMIGDYPLAVVNRDRALDRLSRRFHPIWLQFAHAGAVLAYTFAGQWERALREAEEAVAEGQSHGESGIVSFNAAFAAFVCVEQRDWDRAAAYAQFALHEAPTVYFEGIPQMFLASLLCSTGKPEQGVPILEAIVPMAEASEHRVIWMYAVNFLADAYAFSGRVEDARAVLGPVLAWAERVGAGYLTARSHRTMAAIDAAAGAETAALSHLDRAIEVAQRTGSENELALALASRGRLLLDSTGRGDLERALAIFNRLGTLVEPDRIRAELAVTP
jgi:class 3 adenylate cyclase/tetratricopeptide (TPR) repeat protein